MIIDKTHLKSDFRALSIAHSSIKLNKMDTKSLTWIFTSNNGIICHVPDIDAGNQLW